MKIGEKAIQEASKQIEGLMRDHLQDINEAYLNTGDISIGLKANFAYGGEGRWEISAEIGFIKEKVKDKSFASTIYENQEEIRFPEVVRNEGTI